MLSAGTPLVKQRTVLRLMADFSKISSYPRILATSHEQTTIILGLQVQSIAVASLQL